MSDKGLRCSPMGELAFPRNVVADTKNPPWINNASRKNVSGDGDNSSVARTARMAKMLP
jgi:hypothetical protein